MASYGSKILNNAVSSLRAQQAVIATTGNNIANVNTPGYTRRVVKLETAESTREGGGLALGNGVRVGGVARVADEYLQKLMYGAAGDKFSNDIQNQFLSRIDQVYGLTGDQTTIGSALTDFFSAINDLTANPSSIELRANVIERTEDLTTAINNTYNFLANLQTEADDRIKTEIQTVNAITKQIADLNFKITGVEAGGNATAADERDARDTLLQSLAEKVSFNYVELADGSINISLANGFTLVHGNQAVALNATPSPSFAAGSVPPSLSGGGLSYITYSYSSNSDIDLTETIMNGGGSLAGYLKMRGYADPANTSAFQAEGVIPDIASRVEAVSRTLLTKFNQIYLGPDRDSGTAYWDPSSGDLNGAPPSVFGLFDFTYSGAKDTGATPDGYPTTGDLDNLVNSGAIKNYSSLLKPTFSDPRRLAAARDSGAGAPAAAVFAEGDARNMQAIADLQKTVINFSAGSFSLNATPDEMYTQMVGYVGNLRAASDVATKVAKDNFTTASDRRDQVSAVSLDEEFTGLITFQKAYQASAKLVRIADEMLQEIIGLL